MNSEYEKMKKIVIRKLIDKTEDRDYEELSEELFGEGNCFNSSEVRKRMYGMRALIEAKIRDEENGIIDDDLLNKIKEEKLELEKLKIQYQDQKREYRAFLRSDARFEHLKEEVIKAIKDNVYKPFDVSFIDDTKNNHMVALCSDWHIGLECDNYWNKVNIEIMKERIKKYQDKIIQLATRHNVDTLHLEITGDIINGLIHTSTRIFNDEDVISQSILASELLCNMIYNIAKSKTVNKINVYCTSGNHGRVSARKEESLSIENFERLIPWHLKTKLGEVQNVEIVDNEIDESIICYSFLNETIFSVHGHNDKIGTVIDDLSKMLKVFPTEVHMGHFHHDYENENCDISVVVNGCLSGVDCYAKDIRKSGKPSQTVMIYNNEGRECTYRIKF